LPIGSSLAETHGRHSPHAGDPPHGDGQDGQAGAQAPGARNGGERASAGRGDIDRAARDGGNTLDGPAGS
jgi:hypothetical protein